MEIILGLSIVILIIGIVMIWYARKLQKEIYIFTNELEECINDLSLGKELQKEEIYDTKLWNRIYQKLIRMQTIWQHKNNENINEKEKIKELISDISHQTKTPIANIKMYLEILLAEQNVDDYSEFLNRMEHQVDKLDFLIQSLVKMSRLETGIIEIEKQNTSILKTLGKSVASIIPLAENKSIEIHVDCKEEISILHDRKWLGEAIFNVLDNAVKYTNENGKIFVTVKKQEMFTKISIKDTGKGISLERQAEIFKRFYREPEVHEIDGVGVGLYLARKIVTLQDGYIYVQSKNNQGSTFSICLPNQ